MKSINILILLAFLSCSRTDKNNSIELSNLNEEAIKPSTTFSSFPNWIKEMYPTEFNDGYQNLSQKLIKFTTLDNDIAYLIYSTNDYVCETTLLVIFYAQTENKRIIIGKSCDFDLSEPVQKWTSFKILGNDEIEVTEYTESVDPKYIDPDGILNDSVDYFEIKEKHMDSLVYRIKVTPTGDILKKA